MSNRVRLQLICTVAAIFCFLAGRYAGELGIVFYMLCPVPILYLTLRCGTLTGVVGSIVSIMAIAVASPASVALQYGLVFGLSSVSLGYLLRVTRWDKAVGYTAILIFLVTITVSTLLAYSQDKNLIDIISSYVAAEVELAQGQYAAMDIQGEQLTQLENAGNLIETWAPRIFPGMLLLCIGMLNYLAFLLVRRLPKAAGSYGVDFPEWKAPEPLVWVLIAAGFSLAAPEGYWTIIAVNLLIVLLPIYFLQGLAVMGVFMNRRNVPPIVKGLIYCLLLLNPLPMMVATLGLFDIWADFRRPRITKS